MIDEETLIVIPARYGSSRLPGKVLELIHGYPMIYWVAKRVYQAKLAPLLVATDTLNVYDICKKYDIPVILTSPDLKNGTERVFEVTKNVKGYKRFINIQGDEPLINLRVIKDVMDKSKINAFNTAISKISCEQPNNVSEVKVVLDKHHNILYASRSNIPYFREKSDLDRYKIHGIYCYTREVLEEYISAEIGPLEKAESVEQLRCIESNIPIYGVLTEHTERSVDTKVDLEYMRNQALSKFVSERLI